MLASHVSNSVSVVVESQLMSSSRGCYFSGSKCVEHRRTDVLAYPGVFNQLARYIGQEDVFGLTILLHSM